MPIKPWTTLLLPVLFIACGTLSSVPDFDAKHSSVSASQAIALADGNTPVTITVKLQYSATVPAQGVPVVVSVTGAAVTLANASGKTNAAGVFTTSMTGVVPGTVRVAAGIRGQVGGATLVTSVQFVSVAAAASLSFSAISTVGVPETATVTILDTAGQRVLYYDGTVGFTSSDPLASLPPVYQFTAADQGQHSFDSIAFNTPGEQNLVVTDLGNANITASYGPINVSVKTAPMLEVSGVASAWAGTPGVVRVRVVDVYSKTQTGYTGTIHFTSTDPLATLPADSTFTSTDAGVKVLPLTLKTAGLQSVSAVDVSNVVISGIQDRIAVFVHADRFQVAASAPAIAGTPVAVRVTAADAFGNVDPNYMGPAVVSSTDAHASLPQPYTFTPADAGSHDMNVTLYTSGPQTLTLQGASAGFSGATSVAVAGAAAQRLALLGPLQAIAGTPVTLVATAYDLYGNISGDYSGLLALGSSDPNATLPASVAVTPASAGSAVITSVVLKAAGAQTLSVTDAHLALSANTFITVSNGPATTFAVGGLMAASAGHVQSITAAVFDAFGNPALDYTGSVEVVSDDSHAQLPPTTTFTLTDAGTRTLAPVVLRTAGLRRVTVIDTANPNLRGSDGNILVSPLPASALVIDADAQTPVGSEENIVVRAVDLYGNLDPNFAGTVTLSSSDVSASLPAAYTFEAADAGQATLVAALYTSGSQTLSASAGSITSAPALIDVVANTTTKLGLSGLTSGRAGRAQSLVIQAVDNFNNLVPSYVGSVQVLSTDANAGLPGAVTFLAADGGQKLVTVTLLTAGPQAVMAHDVAIPSIAGTQGNVVITAIADHLRVQAPSVLTAGGNFTLSVAGVDAYNNIDTTYTGTVALTTSSTGSTLPATLSITAGMQGVATTNDVALLGAGTQLSIAAQDTLQPFSGSRNGMSVLPGPAAALQVQAASSAYVGLPFSATLTAYDAYGNQATGYTGSVTLTSTDPGASLGGVISFVAGGQGSTTVAGLTWSAASAGTTLTATDTQASGITGHQSGIVVRAGGAAKLQISGATSGPAGHTDMVTVVALDNSNNLATAYTGTVRLTSSDTQAVLPATYAYTGSDAGSHTFAVTWSTAGVQTLAAQDTGIAALHANQNDIRIVSQPAQGLRLTDVSGGGAVAGVARSLHLAAVDAFGNVDTHYTGSVTFASSDTGATLPGPLTMNIGAAGAANITYTLATAGLQTVSASDAGSPALTGNIGNLAVQPGALAALSVSGIANAPAGTSNAATLAAVDAYGNQVPTYTGTVHLTSSDPLAVLSGDITFHAQDQGSRSAALTLFTGGQQSVTATDTQVGSIAGTQAHIQVTSSRTRLSITAPSSVTALQAFNITVAAVDAYGNIDPNYTGSVALTCSDAQGLFGSASSGGPGSPASLTFAGADAGRKTLSGVLLALATSSASISATDGAQALTGQRTGIVVAPGPAAHFAVGAPTAISPGSPFAAQISAIDHANNVVTSYTGSLALTSTDSGATLPTSVTLGAADAGSLRLGNLALVTTGTQTVTLTDANGVMGSAQITVTAQAPVALRVAGATSGVAGHSDSVTVTAIDAFGNPADGNVGVVTLTSTDPQAALPAPYAFGAINTHTFAGVQWMTVGTQTLRAAAAPPAGAVLSGQQNNIVIGGNAATRLTFVGLQDATAGQTQNVLLVATDAFGNIDPNFAGSVGWTSSDAHAALPPSATLANGQAHVAITLQTVGAQTVSASSGGLAGTSASVAITAAAANRFVVTGVAGGVAGQSANATIGAYDAYNNLATSYLGVVALTSSDPVAALPAALVFGAADAGSKSVAVAFFTLGTQTLTATDTFTASINGQQSGIVITPSQHFVITGPANVGGGQPLSIDVQAVDNSNNLDTTFTGTVHFLSTDAQATLPADVTFTGADGGHKTISGFALATAGTVAGIMGTTQPAGRSGALYPITVSIGTAAGFSIAAPSSVTAGSNFNVTIAAVDSYGNRVPSYTGNAAIASNDANAILPGYVAFAAGSAGVQVIGATLRTATSSASLSATDTSNPAFSGYQGNITVTPLATLSSLALSGLSSGAAGHLNSLTVAALDGYGNRVPQYRGTVAFTSSDALAGLPSSYTFIGADHGAHTFAGVTLASVGNQTVSVGDGVYSSSQRAVITPAAATFFALSTYASATAGQAQNVVIVATDPYGNIDTNYAGSVTLTSNDPMALLPATYTFGGFDAGRHALVVTFQSAGTQSVTATGADGISGTQGGVVVNPGATSRLSLSGIAQATTGTPTGITMRALDAAGNTTPAYRGTVHLISSDAHASLPADYAYTANAGGQHGASVAFATSGNQSLTATDNATPAITGTLANIAVTAPAARLRLVLAASATAGAATPLVVQVTDNFNNLATAYTGTVLLNISDAQATYAAQVNFAPADQGNKQVPGIFETAGTQSISAADSQGSITSTSVTVQIAPAATDHYDVATAATVAAGGNIALSLVARDAYGNLVPTYAGTARWSSSDVTASLPANVAFGGGTATSGPARATRAVVGTTFTATDVALPALSGTSAGITVTPLATVALTVSGATAGVAGHAQGITVSARDIYNNLVPSYRGTVAVGSSDAAAILPPSGAFTSGDAGSHAFTGLALVTAGNQTFVATDTTTPGITGQQAGIVINAGAATQWLVAGPASTTAGAAQTLAIAAVDAYGNHDASFRGSVTLSSTDPAASLPGPYAFTAGDAGNHNLMATLATAGAQTLTAAGGGLTAGQTSVAVAPAAMRHLAVGGLATAPAGTPQSVTVRAIDDYNNTTPTYRGSVTFASSDTQASLPGNYLFLSGDMGSKALPVTLLTRGLQQLRAVDTQNPNLAGAQNAIVTVAQTQLTVVSDTNVTAGTSFNVTLSATDAYGNVNPNYTGTVHLTSSDPNATLPGDVTFLPGNQGMVTLTRQTIFKTAGLSQSLTATDTTNAFVGTQSGIAVSPASAAMLAVAPPASVTAGALFTVSVTAYDAYGNAATGYTGRIAFAASDTNASLPPASTFTLASLGTKSFINGMRLLRAGTQVITVTDSNNALSGNGTTSVQSAAPSALVLSGPAGTVAGLPLTLTMTAYDAYGNVATGMNDTIALAGSDPSATYPPAATFVPADAGVKVLTNLTTLRTAGLVGLTATDTSNTGVTSGLFYVFTTPAPIASLVINAPAAVTAATSFSCTVSGVDAYANVVSNYSGTVGLVSTDLAGLPSPVTSFPVSFAAGTLAQRTVSGLRLLTAGSQVLSAQDANGIIFGSIPVTVNPGAAAVVLLATSANATAGQAVDVTVTALDAGANVAPSFVGSISLSSTDANATLPTPVNFAAGDHGQKLLPASLTWRTAGSRTLTASGTGLVAGNANVSVAAANAAGLQVFGIGNLLAGANNQATVRAIDTFGNTAPAYTGTLVWSSSDPAASLPAATALAPTDMGSKTAAVRLYTAGVQWVTATDGNHGYSATQANIVVGVQRSRFTVASPNTTTAGLPIALTIAATDAYNNLDTNFVGALHFTSSDANAGLPSGISMAASDHGQKNVGNVILTTASPNAIVTVLDNTNTVVGTMGAIAVAPGNATRLGVVTAVSTPAGTPLTAAVTAYDAYNNIATGYTGTVAVTSSNANAVLPVPSTFAGNSNGTSSISGIYLLSSTNSASVTVTDTNVVGLSGTQSGIQVTPLGADHFVLGGLTSGAAGHVSSLSVVTRDIYNNIATGYRGTVGFTSSDPGAHLPTNTAYTGGDQGSHTFSGVALDTVGTQSVTAYDTAQPSITGTQGGVVITGNSASHLALTGGTSTIAGQAQNILIVAVDAYGNVDPNFAGTVTFATTDPCAQVPASYVFTSSDAGTHLLPVTYTTAATQTLTATGPIAVGSTQTNTAVSPSNANAYLLSGIPNAPAGQATSVTVRVVDAYNNTVPLYRGQAHFTTSDPNATSYLPTDYTFIAADNGVKALGLTLVTAGTQWVRATDTNNSSITGQQSGIVVGVAQSHLQVTCNTNAVAGVAFPVTVTAVDAYGNLNTAYTGRVHFTSGDANALLPGDTNVTNANNGSITVPGVILRIATANQSISATDTNVSTFTGAQSGIAVSPANANALALTGPASQTAGVLFSGAVTAYDAFNNIATGYTGRVVFSSTDAAPTLPPATSFTTGYAGTHAFANAFALTRTGNQNIVVADANNNLAATLSIAVSAAAPASLALSTPATSTAGNVIVAQVQAQDAYGNTAPTYRGTVAFSSGDPCATYPSSYTFVAGDNGNRTFSSGLVLRAGGAQVINVADVNNTSLGAGASLITVNGASLNSFRISAPASVTSESSFVVTLAGIDVYGNVANTYTGTARLTSSDPNGTPSPTSPISFTFASGTAVQRSVSGIFLNSGGNQVLYARDANNPNTLSGQANVTVIPLPAATLTLSGFPTPLTAGQQGNITVRAYDNYGNIATGYAGTVVFSSSDPMAVLNPNYTFVPSDQGAHTFSNLSLRTANSNQSITAADANGITGTQGSIIVNANAPNSLLLTGSSTAVAGSNFNVTASARDIYNNIATSYTGTITFTSSNANAIKPAAYTFTTGSGGDNGTHTFTNPNGVTIYLSGSQNVRITDAGARASTLPVSVSPANANALVWTAPATSVAGTPLTTSITAYDPYGNLATGYRGAVTVSSSDTSAQLPTAYTFTPGDSGAHVFNGNINLVTSGTKTLVATDGNVATNVRPGQTSVVVSPNVTTQFAVTVPTSVQPALPYSATIASRDAYNNATPAYTGSVNLLSSDSTGTPTTSTPVTITFSAGNNGSVTVGNLRLKVLGSQSLSARDASVTSIQGTGSTLVQAQNFTTAFNFNTTTQPTFNYNSAKVAVGLSSAYLTPIYTTSGDSNAAHFAAGNSNGLAWDSNGYVRLAPGASPAPYTFYSSIEPFDPPLTWVNTVDTVLGNSNVNGICCGLTGPQTNPNTAQYWSGTTSLLYSGNSLGGGNSFAYNQLWNLQGQNMTLDANSYISYYIFPQAQTGALGNANVTGNNSMYVALNVVFTDGTDTKSSAATDGNGILLNPNSQGAGGKLVLNQWNYVRASLGSAPWIGKSVARIDLGWQNNNSPGGYRGYIDDVFLSGTTSTPQTNRAAFDATWAPAWGNLVAYWSFDGAGALANNANMTANVGPALQVHNNNNAGFVYANGVVNQALYMDGLDDYLQIPTTGFPNATAMTFSIWHRSIYDSKYVCPRIYELSGSTGRTGIYPNCNNGLTCLQFVYGGSTYDAAAAPAMGQGRWAHYVSTIDPNGSAKFYINGALAASLTNSFPLASVLGSTNLIGGSVTGLDNYARGFFDEGAVWNVALTQNQVESIYRRQSAAFSGSLTSRVFAPPFQGAAATGLSWTSTLPSGKPLPGAGLSETTIAYSGLSNSALDANLVTLWHFDEPALATLIGGDFYDDSGSGNVGVAWQSGCNYPQVNLPGEFNRAIAAVPFCVNGVIGQTLFANPTTFTTQVWFNRSYLQSGDMISFGSSATGYSAAYDRLTYMNVSGQIVFGVFSNSTIVPITSPSSYTDGKWHHAVSSLSPAGMRLFIDGQMVASNTGTTTAQPGYSGYWHVGCESIGPWPGVGNYCFEAGRVDEVAVWSRALSASEVFQLYRRGANRVKYQVKICSASDCSDVTTWQGPDASALSYFSELNNMPGLSGYPGAPYLPFANVAPNLVVNANAPYVQYRMVLESDDANQLCVYNGVSAPCSPEISTTQFFRTNYDTSVPTISNTLTTPYYQLQTLTGALGAAGCPAGVTYVLSPDGTNNYYYNGATWAASNGSVAQSNTVAQLTSSAMGAFSTQFPFGQTYFNALLASDGVHPCALANLTWTGTQ